MSHLNPEQPETYYCQCGAVILKDLEGKRHFTCDCSPDDWKEDGGYLPHNENPIEAMHNHELLMVSMAILADIDSVKVKAALAHLSVLSERLSNGDYTDKPGRKTL